MTEPVMKYAAIMRAQIDSLNSVAQNASNSNTAGYLQENSSISASQFMKMVYEGSSVPRLEKDYNQTLAGLKITNINTDIGLLSNAWFVLNSENEPLVTRNGRFNVSAEGYLMFGSHQVIGASGPISGLANNDFQVHADGSIYQNETFIGQIKTVILSDDASLKSLGKGVYAVSGSVSEAKNSEIVQGALVGSNVNLESDMMSVIETSRHIEMLQRAMSAYDNMLDTGINKIGK